MYTIFLSPDGSVYNRDTTKAPYGWMGIDPLLRFGDVDVEVFEGELEVPSAETLTIWYRLLRKPMEESFQPNTKTLDMKYDSASVRMMTALIFDERKAPSPEELKELLMRETLTPYRVFDGQLVTRFRTNGTSVQKMLKV